MKSYTVSPEGVSRPSPVFLMSRSSDLPQKLVNIQRRLETHPQSRASFLIMSAGVVNTAAVSVPPNIPGSEVLTAIADSPT